MKTTFRCSEISDLLMKTCIRHNYRYFFAYKQRPHQKSFPGPILANIGIPLAFVAEYWPILAIYWDLSKQH